MFILMFCRAPQKPFEGTKVPAGILLVVPGLECKIVLKWITNK
jgi:hypothetical protein